MKKLSNIFFIVGVLMILLSALLYRNHMNKTLVEAQQKLQQEQLKTQTLKAEMENLKNEEELVIKENNDNIYIEGNLEEESRDEPQVDINDVIQGKEEATEETDSDEESLEEEENEDMDDEINSSEANNTITFYIETGLDSIEIADFLEKEGVITKEDFLREVDSKGVEKRLMQGEFTVRKGISAEELVAKLTKKQP